MVPSGGSIICSNLVLANLPAPARKTTGAIRRLAAPGGWCCPFGPCSPSRKRISGFHGVARIPHSRVRRSVALMVAPIGRIASPAQAVGYFECDGYYAKEDRGGQGSECRGGAPKHLYTGNFVRPPPVRGDQRVAPCRVKGHSIQRAVRPSGLPDACLQPSDHHGTVDEHMSPCNMRTIGFLLAGACYGRTPRQARDPPALLRRSSKGSSRLTPIPTKSRTPSYLRSSSAGERRR